MQELVVESLASGLVSSVPAPRQPLRCSTMRPPGFPGNRPARKCHALRPRARSPPPRPHRWRRCSLFDPPEDRRPSRPMQIRGSIGGLACERFGPGSHQAHLHHSVLGKVADLWRGSGSWNQQTFRTRFRRSPSRHLVPLDRAFPAHALLHESELARTDPDPQFLHRPMRYDIGLPSPVI